MVLIVLDFESVKSVVSILFNAFIYNLFVYQTEIVEEHKSSVQRKYKL